MSTYYDKVLSRRNQNLMNDIIAVLQRHKGKANGIKIHDLCNALDMYTEDMERNVRDHINLLRNIEGELIGSGITGYYLCEDMDEVVEYLKKKFIKPMLNMGKTVRNQVGTAMRTMKEVPPWLWAFANFTNQLDSAAAKEKEAKQSTLF